MNRSSAISSIRDIAEHFDMVTGVVERSKRHVDKSFASDELSILSELRNVRQFSICWRRQTWAFSRHRTIINILFWCDSLSSVSVDWFNWLELVHFHYNIKGWGWIWENFELKFSSMRMSSNEFVISWISEFIKPVNISGLEISNEQFSASKYKLSIPANLTLWVLDDWFEIICFLALSSIL